MCLVARIHTGDAYQRLFESKPKRASGAANVIVLSDSVPEYTVEENVTNAGDVSTGMR